MNLTILGTLIRDIRQNSTKLSQEELADNVGLERTYISKIESGKKNITVETLGAICKGLNITVSELFKMYDDKIKAVEEDGE